MSPESVFFVTTFPYREPVTCTSTASHGSGNRFSNSLSGIEPLFPDTRYLYGRQVAYSRKLIEQTFEGPVDDAKPSVICNNYLESPEVLRSIWLQGRSFVALELLYSSI